MATEKIYYQDAHQAAFQARVLSCQPGKHGYDVVLDRTCFYPEGGGQPGDTGFLSGVRVTDTHERSGEIVHFCEQPLAEGQTFDNPAAEISERYTQPPKAFTEDTLLSAMESAGKEDTPEDAERKGLGTTATRAGIIEKLISAGFAERKGKKLIPTKDGYNLVAILPDSLTSPQLTAEWETRLTGIAKGSDSPADFMRGIEEMTAGLVKTYSAISEDKAKLFTPQREAIGTCPRCGAAVYEGKKNFYCSDRACSFVMWKNDRFFEQRKKAFTKAIAAALLKDGKVKIKGMYSTKTGKTFDGVVLLADTGGKYVNFRVEQNRK